MFALADAVLAESTNPLSVVGAAILSSLVITRESGVSLARDLSRSRPHKISSKTVKVPLDFWKAKAEAFARFYETNVSTITPAGTSDIRLGDARSLDIAESSVDVVLTSPPYLNAIDYIRTSKFSLIFFGCELSALREIRSDLIGTEVGLPAGRLTKELDDLVDSAVAESTRRPMIRRYLFDLDRCLAETYRVLKPGGLAVYVLGPSIGSRSRYDSVSVFSTVAAQHSFDSFASARRSFSVANRSLPPPDRTKRRKSINQRMTCEFYVGLRKPSG